MATPTLYRSTDTSAPVLTGEVGKLIDLLDAILVDGYGSKAAAGWTKPYSGTNKAAYRNSGTQTFVRVVDDNARFGSLGVAEVWGYSSMSDVDTGVGQFPTAANIGTDPTQRKQITKSITTDSTARKWAALATDKTLILCIEQGDGYARTTWVYFIGDYISFVPSDTSNFALFASNWEEDTTPSTSTGFFAPYNYTALDLDVSIDASTCYGALRQSIESSPTTGSNAALSTLRIADDSTGVESGSTGFDTPPHPVYGYPLSETFLVDTAAAVVRGRIPSLMFVNCNMDDDTNGFTNFQTISIADPNEGTKDYLYTGKARRWNFPSTSNMGGHLINLEASDWP